MTLWCSWVCVCVCICVYTGLVASQWLPRHSTALPRPTQSCLSVNTTSGRHPNASLSSLPENFCSRPPAHEDPFQLNISAFHFKSLPLELLSQIYGGLWNKHRSHSHHRYPRTTKPPGIQSLSRYWMFDIKALKMYVSYSSFRRKKNFTIEILRLAAIVPPAWRV